MAVGIVEVGMVEVVGITKMSRTVVLVINYKEL